MQFPSTETGPPGPFAPAPPPPGPSVVRLWLLPSSLCRRTEHNPPRKLRVSSPKLRVSKSTRGGAGGGAQGPGAGAGGESERGPAHGAPMGPGPWRGLGPRQGQQAMGLGRLRGLGGHGIGEG